MPDKKLPVSFGKEDIEFIEKRPLYKGFFSLILYRFRHRLFNGGMSDIISREVFERGHAAVLLPYDVKRDQLVLIEQIRIAAQETSKTPWLLELIAGMIEPGEEIEHVCRREAAEEAGLNVGRCRQIMSYLASPGGTSERLTIYIGEVDASIAGGIHGLAQENEDIRVHVVDRQQAFHWVEQGIIDNAASIIAIQWLQLHLQEVRRAWLENDDLNNK